MSEKTGIEWTDATWNPVRGCSRVSPGCQNCYAERVAARFGGMEEGRETGGPEGWVVTKPAGPFHGFAEMTPQGPRWTGKVALVEEHLLDPLHWRKPRRIFVNSMSDLFHESLPDEAIDRVFAVMALAPRHTFQILTKRAERMRHYFAPIGGTSRADWVFSAMARILNVSHLPYPGWPLPNVWLGVSAEDQERLDERVPSLLSTPAAVRFVSAEPLLGRLDLKARPGADRTLCLICGESLGAAHSHPGGYQHHGLDWIIVGGESGPGSRPCDIAWVRSIVAQCKAAGVSVFVKQLGALIGGDPGDFVVDRWVGAGWKFVPPAFKSEYAPEASSRPEGAIGFQLFDRKGGNTAEWPEELRVREFPR